ncbi:MAG TPA: M28 family peptidase, partial [Bacteroidales bacterium]|nr:M28 family peptidase [Bacteroidales bacterium]
GASGVGVLLEMARQFSLHPPPVGVDIILFDAEDYGEPHGYENPRAEHWALGSQYWSRNPHVPNYRARFGILPDMVGATDAVFTFEGTSMQYAPDIMRRVWDVGHALGYGSYFLRQNTSPIIHDHYFINKLTGIPVINIIHYDAESPSGWFFDQWHTIEDDMDVIDPISLGVVGRTMLTVVFLEN